MWVGENGYGFYRHHTQALIGNSHDARRRLQFGYSKVQPLLALLRHGHLPVEVVHLQLVLGHEHMEDDYGKEPRTHEYGREKGQGTVSTNRPRGPVRYDPEVPVSVW